MRYDDGIRNPSQEDQAMTDETARVLAEHGSPRARAEYAIHEAKRIYSERCAQATGAQSYEEAMTAIDRAKRERSAALTDALIAWDTGSAPGEPDGYLIGGARDLVPDRGRSVFDEWCARVLVRPQIPAGPVYADQRGHDVAWMTAAERDALPA